jgi:site-specific recombinase XerD
MVNPANLALLDNEQHRTCHHVATSMVNDDVPLMVIQKVLDHGSMEMTAHYARLHDETLRREVRRWHERVNIRGERIALATDGRCRRRHG